MMIVDSDFRFLTNFVSWCSYLCSIVIDNDVEYGRRCLHQATESHRASEDGAHRCLTNSVKMLNDIDAKVPRILEKIHIPKDATQVGFRML